jgi:putative copper resistance protein D
VDEALVLCRLLQFASAMLLFGISIFQSKLAPAALAHALDGSLRQLSKPVAIVCLATMIGWLLLASGEMGEGWPDVWNPSAVLSVLLDTDFGRVWQWRLGLAVVLVGVLIFGRDDYWLAVALLAALTLGSLGFVGHAVMRMGALGWLNRLSHVMHLLAAGFWLGSLVPLIASLRLTNDQAASANALLALRRFSSLGQIAVTTVLGTGVVNSWLVLDAWPIGSSPYQALLLAKIAVVAIMVALALANRYLLLPRFDTAPNALCVLRWSAIGETIMGFGAVGLASIIGILPPT